jgi:glyceraldehyde-3-phosphate dehydrogenase/erythrose-4-phosphate dehydrogenase
VTYRIAINGFGRIGRNYLRRLMEPGIANAGFQVVAITTCGTPPRWRICWSTTPRSAGSVTR